LLQIRETAQAGNRSGLPPGYRRRVCCPSSARRTL